jgi:hypothetical protein
MDILRDFGVTVGFIGLVLAPRLLQLYIAKRLHDESQSDGSN